MLFRKSRYNKRRPRRLHGLRFFCAGDGRIRRAERGIRKLHMCGSGACLRRMALQMREKESCDVKAVCTLLLALALAAGAFGVACAAPGSSYEFSTSGLDGLSVAISSADVLNGNVGTIEAGGFHGASTPDSLPALTDGAPGGGLTSVLADFSNPSLQVYWDFASAVDVALIRVFTQNANERVFQSYDVEVFRDGDLDWVPVLLGVQTGPYLTTWAAAGSPDACMTTVWDDTGTLAAGVLSLRLTFYGVGNTGDYYVDPWDPGHPRDTDNFNAAFVASLVKEIDVEVVPEPGSLLALAGGLAGFSAMIRRRA